MAIQQWTVTTESGRNTRIFENEGLALEAAMYNAQVSVPSVIRYPDGEEFVILKRHPAWTVFVGKTI